tara:strand:- start:7819 stop:9594 length:1776 start_codon:yes stop_codon:yes gene_type:complete
MRELLQRVFPLLSDVLQQRGSNLPQDVLAGSITAILLIPQALAYAVLAGLPPEVGLYASVLPTVIYAFLGSSRTLSVGPVAVAAVMVASTLTAYAGSDPDKYLSGALMLSALTGALLLGLSLLRMGWLTHFISHPVLSGFTTGAAIFILGTQIAPLLGISAPRDGHFPELLLAVAGNIYSVNPVTAAMGAVSVIALLLARGPLIAQLQGLGASESLARTLSRTAPLLLVVVATVLCAWLGLADRHHVAVVGSVPQGMPDASLAFLAQEGWLVLLPGAALIAVIAYVESISVARALAFRRHERISPDRELMALGVSNVTGAIVGAMPVAGGFSRSIVNFEAGAKTQAAAVVTAVWVALATMFFAGMLADLPKAVLSAIIVVAVFQLIDLPALRHTWSYDRADGLAQGATIAGVLVMGIEAGLLTGVVLGAAAFLYRTSRPHIAIVGRIPGTEHFRNVDRYQVTTWPGLLILRVDENFYFANAPRLENDLLNIVAGQKDLSCLVLILSGVGYVDASGLQMLESFERSLREKGITLHLSEVKGPVMDRLAGTELLQQLDDSRIHLTTDSAVRRLAETASGPVDLARPQKPSRDA